MYSVCFQLEKQRFVGRAKIKVLIDHEKVCELSFTQCSTKTVQVEYGRHELTLLASNPMGTEHRTTIDIFVKQDGVISVKWDRVSGKPRLEEVSAFLEDLESERKIETEMVFASDGLAVEGKFLQTKAVENYLWLDERKKRFALPQTNWSGKVVEVFEFKYSDLLDYEVICNNDVLVKSGGIGRAVVGGALFGGVGAIVGGVTAKRKQIKICSELKIKLILDNVQLPIVYIDFDKGMKLKEGSLLFKQIAGAVEETAALLQIVVSENRNVERIAPQEPASAADEILKFKRLLDTGIITESEFLAKKKQLLGL